MILRDYQERAKKDIEDFLFKSKSKRGLLVACVAAGKSLYPSLITQMVNEPVLVIQPNKELLVQNFEKARAFGIEPTIYSASLKSKEISDITYATPMSIVNNPEKFERFNYVIVDESHLAFTSTVSGGRVTSKSRLETFLEKIKPKKVIGLTATPIQLVSNGFGSTLKMMNRSLRSFWNQAEIFHVTQICDIQSKYWSDVKIRMDYPRSNVLVLNSNGTEFKEESIIAQYEANNTTDRIIHHYKRALEEGRKSILTFVPYVKHAYELQRTLKDGSFVITGDTPAKERDTIINDFKNGKIRHVINVFVLSAGFDHPGLDTVIMARETNSFAVYYQIFGRLVRPLIKDGKVIRQKDLFIDLTGNTTRFGDIRDITFEKHDYINGWGMFNGDRLLTGFPTGSWDMPTRETLQKEYEDKINKKNLNKDTYGYRNVQIGFGKYKGKTLLEISKKDPGYLSWVFHNFDFSKKWTREYKRPIYKMLHEITIENK